jgi:hypothetical protein
MILREPKDFLVANYIPEPNSGCWLWLRSLNQDGYGSMSVRSRSDRTHRVAWRSFKGVIPRGMCVCHRCDVRSCVNPDHLFLGTKRDNDADMRAKGRHSPLPSTRGERNARAKLGEGDVGEIRRRRRQGENWKILAREYGVSHKTIWKVNAGLSWKGDC